MKSSVLICLSVVIMLSCVVVFSCDSDSDAYETDYAYHYEIDGFTVTFGLNSDGTASVRNVSSSVNDDLIIPSTVTKNGYTYVVDGVAERAFAYGDMTSVYLPDSITTLGGYAFLFCEELESVHLPNNITRLFSSTFANCESLKSITIPESVVRIDSMVFADCTSLTNVESSGFFESIDSSAFTGCTS